MQKYGHAFLQMSEAIDSVRKSFDKAEFMQSLLALQKTLPETSSVIDIMRNQARD